MIWIILGAVAVVIICIIVVANGRGGSGYGGGGNYYLGGMGGSRSSSSPLSDIRLKQNILPLSNALEKALALQGVYFEWRDNEQPEFTPDSKRHIGLIAQEVEKVIPEIVDTQRNGYKSIRYLELVALLVEAIKEQQLQINDLKSHLLGTGQTDEKTEPLTTDKDGIKNLPNKSLHRIGQ